MNCCWCLTGDDGSIADPDDVLDRFMTQQKHRRYVLCLHPKHRGYINRHNATGRVVNVIYSGQCMCNSSSDALPQSPSARRHNSADFGGMPSTDTGVLTLCDSGLLTETG